MNEEIIESEEVVEVDEFSLGEEIVENITINQSIEVRLAEEKTQRTKGYVYTESECRGINALGL